MISLSKPLTKCACGGEIFFRIVQEEYERDEGDYQCNKCEKWYDLEKTDDVDDIPF